MDATKRDTQDRESYTVRLIRRALPHLITLPTGPVFMWGPGRFLEAGTEMWYAYAIATTLLVELLVFAIAAYFRHSLYHDAGRGELETIRAMSVQTQAPRAN